MKSSTCTINRRFLLELSAIRVITLYMIIHDQKRSGWKRWVSWQKTSIRFYKSKGKCLGVQIQMSLVLCILHILIRSYHYFTCEFFEFPSCISALPSKMFADNIHEVSFLIDSSDLSKRHCLWIAESQVVKSEWNKKYADTVDDTNGITVHLKNEYFIHHTTNLSYRWRTRVIKFFAPLVSQRLMWAYFLVALPKCSILLEENFIVL